MSVPAAWPRSRVRLFESTDGMTDAALQRIKVHLRTAIDTLTAGDLDEARAQTKAAVHAINQVRALAAGVIGPIKRRLRSSGMAPGEFQSTKEQNDETQSQRV